MHKCKYIKWLQGVSPTENVNYIQNSCKNNVFQTQFNSAQTQIGANRHLVG